MRRTHLATTALACLAILSTLAAGTYADEPMIVVEAGATEIFSGEGLDYIVEIRNVDNPSPPDVGALRKDFDVVAVGDESRNQSSRFIINGRITEEHIYGHIYHFRLTPKRTGELTIPAPTATVGGKTITGQELTLKVGVPEAQDLVIAEIKTSRPRLYPTQPFEVTLRVLVRPLPDNVDLDPLGPLRRRPPHIEVNWVDDIPGLTGEDKSEWLSKLISDDGSGFRINEVTTRNGMFFGTPQAAVFNLFRGRENRKGMDGKAVHYYVYELMRMFTAEKSGTYRFGPATVKGAFVSGDGEGQYTGKRLVAVAPAVSLEVREVPTPRPATFCGGIGDYRLAVSAKPKALRVGDPLTLSVEVEKGTGAGSLDLISAPDLSANPRIADEFEIVDKNPTGRKEGDVKRFEYALRPKRTGVGVPALTMTVFDPKTERFTEVASKPITLEVSAASKLAAGDLVGAVSGSPTAEIKSRSQGIYQNVTDFGELRDERVNLNALAGIAAGAWLATGALAVFVSRLRRKSGDLAWRRRRQARRSAEARLAEAREAQAQGRPREALRAVRSALVGLIADMRDLVAEGLTATDVDAALAQAKGLPETERASVLNLLEAVESAEYGPGVAAEAPAMIETASGLIPSLARHLERSS